MGLLLCQESHAWNFPSGPVVKNPPSNAGGAGSIPGQEAEISHALWPKTQKHKSSILINSIKTLKMVHIKKIFKKGVYHGD